MSENFTRTIYGLYLQTCLLENLPFQKVANTTLNEALGILPDATPPSSTIPTQKYFAIGNGGHSFKAGANGISIPTDRGHAGTDANLFNQLPFVLREPSNDLDPIQRASYALRTTVMYNNTRYIAYYLKRLDLSAVRAQMLYKHINADSTETVTPFVPTSANLSPTPPDLSPNGVNVVSGDYVSVTAKTGIVLAPFDIQELQNVANIIYGDPDYAIISEIALVSGVDQLIQAGGSGQSTFNFLEVICAQVCSFFNVLWAVKFTNNNLTAILDVGGTEPVFKLAQATS